MIANSGAKPILAGAWPIAAGKGQSIHSFTWQGSTRGFDNKGRARVDLSFQKYENSVFIEYGLTSNLTLVARPAFQDVRLRTGDVIDEAQGFGATELSLRRLVHGGKKWVISGQAGVFVAGSVENGFDRPLGEKGLDWEVRALAGRSLNWLGQPGFVDLQLGFRERARGSGNEIRFDATYGTYVTPRLQILLQSFFVAGIPSTRATIRTTDSVKAQLGGVWFINDTNGLQLSLARTFLGRNVVRDTGVTLSWWKRF